MKTTVMTTTTMMLDCLWASAPFKPLNPEARLGYDFALFRSDKQRHCTHTNLVSWHLHGTAGSLEHGSKNQTKKIQKTDFHPKPSLFSHSTARSWQRANPKQDMSLMAQNHVLSLSFTQPSDSASITSRLFFSWALSLVRTLQGVFYTLILDSESRGIWRFSREALCLLLVACCFWFPLPNSAQSCCFSFLLFPLYKCKIFWLTTFYILLFLSEEESSTWPCYE
jgi:hypothetical protein